MARKSKQKHARNALKRKMNTPSEPLVSLPSHKTLTGIKISEAILNISAPLREQYRESHRMEAIITIAVMAWNIALFPEEEQAHVQGMLLESLPKHLGGEDVAVLLSAMDTLMARKNLLYPNVREYILTHTLSLSNNTVTLTVGTAPVPGKIQRRSS